MDTRSPCLGQTTKPEPPGRWVWSIGTATCLGALASLCSLTGCADREHQIIVSVPEQRLIVLKKGVPLAVYPVSTSKFGVGDRRGSCATPLGELEIARKIGGGAALGAVFKSREPTGEVLAPDAPGRDPVVTRILWLRGLETKNEHAYERYIYIHGTPEERRIGEPASFGCVRMRSRDVAALYDEVGNGARVFIRDAPLAPATAPYLAAGKAVPPDLSVSRKQAAPSVFQPAAQTVP